MFGVKSLNKPVSGEFAEQMLKHLLENQTEKRKETVSEYTIISD